MWLMEKSTSHGVLPTQYCTALAQTLLLQREAAVSIVLMCPIPARKDKPARLLEKGRNTAVPELRRNCFCKIPKPKRCASTKPACRAHPALQTDTLLQTLAPAENPAPSYSLSTTSWRFLLCKQWGGSDEHPTPSLSQNQVGQVVVDNL